MGLCHRLPVLGTGGFLDGAKMVIDFAFDVIGAHRLEARAAVANGRGNGALRKVGALQEGILRKSFLRNGEYWIRRCGRFWTRTGATRSPSGVPAFTNRAT